MLGHTTGATKSTLFPIYRNVRSTSMRVFKLCKYIKNDLNPSPKKLFLLELYIFLWSRSSETSKKSGPCMSFRAPDPNTDTPKLNSEKIKLNLTKYKMNSANIYIDWTAIQPTASPHFKSYSHDFDPKKKLWGSMPGAPYKPSSPLPLLKFGPLPEIDFFEVSDDLEENRNIFGTKKCSGLGKLKKRRKKN